MYTEDYLRSIPEKVSMKTDDVKKTPQKVLFVLFSSHNGVVLHGVIFSSPNTHSFTANFGIRI